MNTFEEINWYGQFNGSITVCDRKGIVVYMNQRAIEQFQKYGGGNLIGESLVDCHPEPSRTKLLSMLDEQIENIYTTEKNGIRKIVNSSCYSYINFSFRVNTKMNITSLIINPSVVTA